MRSLALFVLLLSALPTTLSAQPPAKIPILIDTDIGSYPDDAFALALALASPEVEVLGVTTCCKQAEDRAWIACRFFTHGGFKPIPVAFGRGNQPDKDIDWQIQYRRHPAPIFNRTQKPEKAPAVDFLHQKLKDQPGKITIVALGPLTNIAQLLKEHPDAAKMIGRLVVMGGSIKVGYDGKRTPEPEWNIKSDIPAAQAVFAAGIPMTLVPLDASGHLSLSAKDRTRLFSAHTLLTLQVQTLYELADEETPVLFDPAALAAAFAERFFTMADLRIEVDDRGMTRSVAGRANNTRVALGIKDQEFLSWYVDRVRQVGEASLPTAPQNLSKLIDLAGFPSRVHVVEDYDTDIEKRWWMTGKAETKDVPPGGKRAQRSVLTQDYDDRQGNMKTSYHAVVFNPVPGPPMGKNTRLSFRYKLLGTDVLRVQLYSLTNGYHRYLSLKGLEQNKWLHGTVDMTQMRRPDGTGGPLAEDERIDDIQFYVDPRAQVLIDDVILYDAAAADETRPFPKRIIYTAGFDTGKQGKEWPGDFDIVPHEKPLKWRSAKSIKRDDGSSWLRLSLKGLRELGTRNELTFRYQAAGADEVKIEFARDKGQVFWSTTAKLSGPGWNTLTLPAPMHVPARGGVALDEIRLILPKGGTLLVDDVLLYEPGEKRK